MNLTRSMRDFPIRSMDQISTRLIVPDWIASMSANSPGRRSRLFLTDVGRSMKTWATVQPRSTATVRKMLYLLIGRYQTVRAGSGVNCDADRHCGDTIIDSSSGNVSGSDLRTPGATATITRAPNAKGSSVLCVMSAGREPGSSITARTNPTREAVRLRIPRDQSLLDRRDRIAVRRYHPGAAEHPLRGRKYGASTRHRDQVPDDRLTHGDAALGHDGCHHEGYRAPASLQDELWPSPTSRKAGDWGAQEVPRPEAGWCGSSPAGV